MHNLAEKNQAAALRMAQNAYDNLRYAEQKLAEAQEAFDKAFDVMENELQRCKDNGVEFEPEEAI